MGPIPQRYFQSVGSFKSSKVTWMWQGRHHGAAHRPAFPVTSVEAVSLWSR